MPEDKDKKMRVQAQRTRRHGSTTKAGKVRGSTPQIPKSSLNRKLSPRRANFLEFQKRFHRKVESKGVREFEL